MAGDWIKMRTDIYRDPKVAVIAEHLIQSESELSRFVNQNCACDMTVTRNVMRNAVVGALVSTWGVVRHQGKRVDDDLHLPQCQIWVIDAIADMPGFGAAMLACGWCVESPQGLVFPMFFAEHNSDPKESEKEKNRRRQQRWREAQRNRDSNVTRNVTNNVRVEKSREEGKDIHEAQNIHMQAVVDAWNMLGFQRCRSLTPKRQKSIKARWRVAAWRDSWKQAIERIRESSFCAGGGKDGWIADIDWFLRPDTVTNILEGKYDNRTTHGRTSAGQGNRVSPEQARQDASVAALLAFRDSGRVSEGDAGPRRLEENGGIHQGAS